MTSQLIQDDLLIPVLSFGGIYGMYSHGFVSRLDAFPNAGQYHDLSVRNGATPSLLVVMRSESTVTKRVTAGRVAGRGTCGEGAFLRRRGR